jgi:hypothetical protein
MTMEAVNTGETSRFVQERVLADIVSPELKAARS